MTSVARRVVACAVAAMAVAASAGVLHAQDTSPDTVPTAPVIRSPPANAADSLIEERTRNLSAQLRCPVCQGLSLQDSPSELSLQMRDVVRSHVASGKTDDEVKAYFVGRYGEWILMSPPAKGFNLLVYVLPMLWLLGGAGVLVFFIRRWTRKPPAPVEG